MCGIAQTANWSTVQTRAPTLIHTSIARDAVLSW